MVRRKVVAKGGIEPPIQGFSDSPASLDESENLLLTDACHCVPQSHPLPEMGITGLL
ncbi:MAG TPA: hypothetical protein VLX30_04515 [Burkholderiales bacterium]|nr:hypothetical protein [Burkholderiales bacterium]